MIRVLFSIVVFVYQLSHNHQQNAQSHHAHNFELLNGKYFQFCSLWKFMFNVHSFILYSNKIQTPYTNFASSLMLFANKSITKATNNIDCLLSTLAMFKAIQKKNVFFLFHSLYLIFNQIVKKEKCHHQN